MRLIADLLTSMERHRELPAFWIDGSFHSYAALSAAVSRIRRAIREGTAPDERIIGLVANDDLETYASIIAIWWEGRAYLPFAPATPIERNQGIIAESGMRSLLSSEPTELSAPSATIATRGLPDTDGDPVRKPGSGADLAYLLYTSGTTGKPKGVPITHGNLQAFCDAFAKLGVNMRSGDRCLQMFELTFDLSVMSYLIPLLHGACVYTVPKDEIKYTFIAGMLEDHRITHALMVPSIINYLRPYFDEINAPGLVHSLFCGEALGCEVAQEWARCVPNARVLNVYGPTEHTIFCTHYSLPSQGAKSMHGMLSIGRPMEGSVIVVRDEEGRLHERSAAGELCLAGPQLTTGYWKNPERNGASFFTAEHGGAPVRFYRTGDLCSIDADGDILYIGRLDQQTKVQGYRVELAEVEHHARECLEKHNAVAVGVTNKLGNTEIALFVEGGDEEDARTVISGLRRRLPAYMVPTIVRRIGVFPLNANGKTDRRALCELAQRSLS
jgi:D-alanine--poly(phosphoribitol) ligase subunit 1